MTAVKNVKKVMSLKRLAIREVTGRNKMAFIIDSSMKRQIVFKPV